MVETSNKKCKPRCAHKECKKKLTLIDLSMTCKCGNNYCSKHRPCETHNCTYDFSKSKEEIDKQIKEMRCVASKLIQV